YRACPSPRRRGRAASRTRRRGRRPGPQGCAAPPRPWRARAARRPPRPTAGRAPAARRAPARPRRRRRPRRAGRCPRAAASRRARARRRPAAAASAGLEQHDRDLAAGLLLVAPVRRERLDAAGPPLRTLVAGRHTRAALVALGAVLDDDVGVGRDAVEPGGVRRRAALAGHG